MAHYLPESERDPRIRLGVLRRVTAEQQATALKLAESWVSGMTYAEIGAEHQMTHQQVRMYMIKHGSYRWAVEQRRRNEEEPEPAPEPARPRPRRPPPPEEPPRRVRPRFAWRVGLTLQERETAKDAQKQADRAWTIERSAAEALCPQCGSCGTEVCHTPDGRRLPRWHKARGDASPAAQAAQAG